MDMTFQDVMALSQMNKEEHKEGNWSVATSLWVIVGIIFVIALLWYVHTSGKDKADLAAAVQNVVGRVNAIEPAVTAQGNSITSINGVLSATTQAIGDYKAVANAQLAALDDAVFVARCSNGCNGNSRFVKRDNYSLCDSSLQSIETCG